MFERSYLENIIVNAPIGIITTDMDLRVTFLSESARGALGLDDVPETSTVTPSDSVTATSTGKSPDRSSSRGTVRTVEEVQNMDTGITRITDIADDPDSMHRYLGSVISGQKPKEVFEAQVSNRVKSRTVQFTASLLRDDYYVPIGLLLMCEDVTDQRATYRKYRNLMENSIDAVIIYKGDSVLEMNPAFTRLTGKTLSPDNILRWEDFIHPESLERVVDFLRRREKGDTTAPEKFECFGIGAGGRKRTWHITVSPVHPDRGIFSMSLHDITDQKELVAQLIQTRRMETVSILAGGIAHDFNNLLTGVLGYSSLIKTTLEQGDSIFAFVDSIESSAMRAKELNDQLVAFARIGKYEIKAVDLNRIVARTVRLLRLSMSKSVSIKINPGVNLRNVKADAPQIQQLITNICINSTEAMPEGGRITLSTENVLLSEPKDMGNWAIPPGEYVHLAIADTGRGISPENIGKIFEPFFSTKGVGFGLGLAAAYGIVKSHKGYIVAESETGRGTTIHIYLPAMAESAEPAKVIEKALVKGTGRILVVDDEDVVREILAEMLKGLGYEVIIADDGDTAVPVYTSEWNKIDAVFLDMVMPGMNGEETFQEFKKVNPDVKVIVCTGYTEEGPIQEMMNEGASGLVKKPFKMDDIARAVSKVLNGSGNTDNNESSA